MLVNPKEIKANRKKKMDFRIRFTFTSSENQQAVSYGLRIVPIMILIGYTFKFGEEFIPRHKYIVTRPAFFIQFIPLDL